MEAVALNPGRLVAAAVIGLVLLLVLIIKFKVQAMVAILIGAIAIGLLAGMPYEQIVTAVNDGIGNTLKGIALLVGRRDPGGLGRRPDPGCDHGKAVRRPEGRLGPGHHRPCDRHAGIL